MLLSHAPQSCTLMIDFTDMQYISDWAVKDLPLAYLNICWRLAGWLAAQDLQPTFQTDVYLRGVPQSCL